MRSRPLPLLPFDTIGAEQLEWDGATDDITATTTVAQRFRCADDGLHRVEVFIEPSFHFTRCHLWLFVFEADPAARDPRRTPLRLAGPLASEKLTAHGWFSFEFEPITNSALRTYAFELQSPDGAPGNALRVRAMKAKPADARGAKALTFRAACLTAPALLPNFQRYRDYAHRRTTEVTHQPLLARLEISRPCNLHCIMCQRGLHPFDPQRESPGFMSLAAVQSLDSILPTLLRVVALGLGEPFLNPQFLEILRCLRSRNAHAHVFTSTNGTRLADAAIDAMLDEGLLAELQISLDGIERRTFEQIRRNASFDVVIGALERVTAARARRRNASLKVTAAMLVMKPNVEQVLGFVQRMAELGVDRISLDSPKDAEFQPLRADSDAEMGRIFEQVNRAEEWLAETDTELSGPLLAELIAWHRRSGEPGPSPRWGVDECARLSPPAGARATACTVPWESFTLAADGSVNVCCNSIRRMGDARTTAIDSVWKRSAGYGQLRQELVTRRLHGDCARCLGENFVVPGEVTPAIYLEGCVVTRAAVAQAGAMLGSRVRADGGGSNLHLELDPPCRALASTPTISGRLTTIDGADLARGEGGEPLVIGVTHDGVLAAVTAATPMERTGAPWSVQLPAGGSAERCEVFLIAANGCRRIAVHTPPQPALQAAGGAQLHGFVDEVRRAGNVVYFRGWVRDARRGAPAASAALMLGDEIVAWVRPSLPRRDVARAFGDSSPDFGYTLGLLVEGLPGRATDAVAVVAVDQNGASAPLEWSEPARFAWSRLLAPRPFARLRETGANAVKLLAKTGRAGLWSGLERLRDRPAIAAQPITTPGEVLRQCRG